MVQQFLKNGFVAADESAPKPEENLKKEQVKANDTKLTNTTALKANDKQNQTS
jgi:hypothetical protein